MDPRSVVLYTVYPQLDALGIDGRARLLGAFASIQSEADDLASNAIEHYRQLGIEADDGLLAEHALNQGIQYGRTLHELRQSVVNLLAVGLHHQFTGHRDQLKRILRARKEAWPAVESFISWPRVDELRLLTNAVKHGDSADLRQVRPDYFIHPSMRDEVSSRVGAPVWNAMGGTEVFVTEADLETYSDALRAFWEEFLEAI